LGDRNGKVVLLMDPDAIEGTVLPGVIPAGADLTGGIEIRVTFTANANTGACRFGAAIDRANASASSDSYDTEATNDAAAPGTALHWVTRSWTISNLDSLASGEPFLLYLRRVATHGNDTLTEEAEILLVELRKAAA
jgi:hypothetical protein